MKALGILFAAFGVVACATAGSASAAAPAPITVEASGAGRPVVLIPGLASGGAVWGGVVSELEGASAHVVTLAGFAGAPPVEGPFFETRLAALRTYLEANDITDAVVVGHSLGGVMAMKLALAEPERVSSIVIVDSVPFLAQFLFGAQTADAAEPFAEQLRAQWIATPGDVFAEQQRVFAATQTSSAEGQAAIVADSLASDRASVANAMAEMITDDMRQKLAALKQPVLVLYPFREGGPFTAEMTDAAYAQQYAAAPNASLKRVDGSGHFIMYDSRRTVVDAVNSALRAKER